MPPPPHHKRIVLSEMSSFVIQRNNVCQNNLESRIRNLQREEHRRRFFMDSSIHDLRSELDLRVRVRSVPLRRFSTPEIRMAEPGRVYKPDTPSGFPNIAQSYIAETYRDVNEVDEFCWKTRLESLPEDVRARVEDRASSEDSGSIQASSARPPKLIRRSQSLYPLRLKTPSSPSSSSTAMSATSTKNKRVSFAY